MSYTSIVMFDNNGNACDEGLAFRNSWRGAMAIWRHMEKQYLKPYIPDCLDDGSITYEEFEEKYGYAPTRLSSLNTDLLKPLWQTIDNPDIPFNERVCMATTLDWVLVAKPDFKKVIDAFRTFPVATSLPEQADAIEKLIDDNTVSVIGWWQNSIVNNLWFDDDGNPYNYKYGTKHWFLFDEVKPTRH